MVEIQITYLGGLRNQATHIPSGTKLLTDAPIDNHGKGETFSPTDLVSTALGCCMSTIMGIAAEQHGWDLKGLSIRVVKHMATEGFRKIRLLEVEIHIPFSEKQDPAGILKKAAMTCPVHHSLNPAIEQKITFHWAEN
ncbi:MAG: osmotically inducible protein OsmC [Verrucomicrobia bacterium]|nr:MAG: osmotically inducible protein OsmC [Verrucomicrobiota bacterium]